MKRNLLLASLIFCHLLPVACAKAQNLPGKFVFHGEYKGKEGVYLLDKAEVNLMKENGVWPVWSRDGKRIACTVSYDKYAQEKDPSINKHIYILDEKGSELKDIKTLHDPISIAWSPNGKILAYIASDDNWKRRLIYRYDIEKEEHKMIYEGDEKDAFSDISFSPDGMRLLFFNSHSATRLGDPEAGCYTINLDGTGLQKIVSGMYPSWYPDGKHILVFRNAHEDGPIPDEPPNAAYFYKADIGNRTFEKVYQGPRLSLGMKLSRDGRHLYYSQSVGRSLKAIVVVPLEGPNKGEKIYAMDPEQYGRYDSPDWYMGE